MSDNNFYGEPVMLSGTRRSYHVSTNIKSIFNPRNKKSKSNHASRQSSGSLSPSPSPTSQCYGFVEL